MTSRVVTEISRVQKEYHFRLLFREMLEEYGKAGAREKIAEIMDREEERLRS